MLCLKLVTGFPLLLGREDKTVLHSLTESEPASTGRWQARAEDFVAQAGDIVVRVEVRPVRDALSRYLLVYCRGRCRIVSDPTFMGREPVFAGTRIPPAHVATMIARGVPLAKVTEDYPALGSADLAFVAIHARMRPDPGRPMKPLMPTRGGVPLPAMEADTQNRREVAHR